MPTKLKNSRHPGGRPPKLNKEEWSQVTCVMKKTTIEKLRTAAGSKHFGSLLQFHLERYPPPTREQYLALTEHKPYWVTIKRKKVPAIIVSAPLWKTEEEKQWYLDQKRAERRKAREARRLEKMSEKDREWEKIMQEEILPSISHDLTRKVD
jgi:hypothetical protein